MLPTARRITVVAADFAFDPDVIRVDADEPVNIILVNRGRVYHDLVVDELGFAIGAEPGGRAQGGLRVADAGRYEVICTVPGHLAAGMRATLVVDQETALRTG